MARIVVTFNEDEFAFLQTTFNDAKTQVRYSPLANATLLALSRAQYVADDDTDTTDDTVPSGSMDDIDSLPDSGEFIPLVGEPAGSEDEAPDSM